MEENWRGWRHMSASRVLGDPRIEVVEAESDPLRERCIRLLDEADARTVRLFDGDDLILHTGEREALRLWICAPETYRARARVWHLTDRQTYLSSVQYGQFLLVVLFDLPRRGLLENAAAGRGRVGQPQGNLARRWPASSAARSVCAARAPGAAPASPSGCRAARPSSPAKPALAGWIGAAAVRTTRSCSGSPWPGSA
jgi:hypothetical protein